MSSHYPFTVDPEIDLWFQVCSNIVLIARFLTTIVTTSFNLTIEVPLCFSSVEWAHLRTLSFLGVRLHDAARFFSSRRTQSGVENNIIGCFCSSDYGWLSCYGTDKFLFEEGFLPCCTSSWTSSFSFECPQYTITADIVRLVHERHASQIGWCKISSIHNLTHSFF